MRSWLEKHAEQILDNSAKTCKDEQNHVWSEEDENRFKNLIELVKQSDEGQATKIGFIGFINWLKSLKERVQPQPKQEWSDWDKTIIESIEALCDEKIESVVFQDVKEHANDIKDWLTDLKERYAWKPSDEQIKSLQESIGIVGELTPRGECLKELVEQLKKLREE